MENSNYEIGQLTAEVKHLGLRMDEIRSDISHIKFSVDELKLWKAQVVMISGIASFLSSGVFFLIGVIIRAWLR